MSPAVLYRLPERGLLEFTGSERVRWLDGQVTNDVSALETGRVMRALVLTHQGRIVSDGWIWALADALWLDLERAAEAPTRAHLERFIVADDVTVHERGASVARFSLDGAGAAAALAAAWEGALPEEGAFAVGAVGPHTVHVAAYGFTGGPAYQLCAPTEAADAVAAALLAAPEVEGGDAAAFERARIEAGTARFGHELDDSVLPAEARLDDAISTTKGCYAGQEVVARMRSRGRVSHLLVGLRFDAGPPAAGSALHHEGRAVGEVTSAVASPALGPIGLGYLKAPLAEPGTELDADGVPARVVALPHAAG